MQEIKIGDIIYLNYGASYIKRLSKKAEKKKKEVIVLSDSETDDEKKKN